MSEADMIGVEVAYALPHEQAIIALEVPEGTTVVEAARRSGIADRFDGIDIDNADFGIFGKEVPATRMLRTGDRVEIYRPLLADPKEVRKARAARARERRASEG